jgi:hypothetical protein
MSVRSYANAPGNDAGSRSGWGPPRKVVDATMGSFRSGLLAPHPAAGSGAMRHALEER